MLCRQLARGATRKVVVSNNDRSAAGPGGAQIDVAAPGGAGRGGERLDPDVGTSVGGVDHHRLAASDAGVDPHVGDRGAGCAEEDQVSTAWLVPECTPGRADVPLPDSTVPIPASTVHGSPGHITAARTYRRSMTAGMIAVAVAPAVTPPPPSSAATPAPATTTTISVTQPAAVLLLAVLHFIPGTDDPAGIVAALASVLGRAASW